MDWVKHMKYYQLILASIDKNVISRVLGIGLTQLTKKLNGHDDFTIDELKTLSCISCMSINDLLKEVNISDQTRILDFGLLSKRYIS